MLNFDLSYYLMFLVAAQLKYAELPSRKKLQKIKQLNCFTKFVLPPNSTQKNTDQLMKEEQ